MRASLRPSVTFTSRPYAVRHDVRVGVGQHGPAVRDPRQALDLDVGVLVVGLLEQRALHPQEREPRVARLVLGDLGHAMHHGDALFGGRLVLTAAPRARRSARPTSPACGRAARAPRRSPSASGRRRTAPRASAPPADTRAPPPGSRDTAPLHRPRARAASRAPDRAGTACRASSSGDGRDLDLLAQHVDQLRRSGRCCSYRRSSASSACAWPWSTSTTSR